MTAKADVIQIEARRLDPRRYLLITSGRLNQQGKSRRAGRDRSRRAVPMFRAPHQLREIRRQAGHRETRRIVSVSFRRSVRTGML
jgi:hypothetical protein